MNKKVFLPQSYYINSEDLIFSAFSIDYNFMMLLCWFLSFSELESYSPHSLHGKEQHAHSSKLLLLCFT